MKREGMVKCWHCEGCGAINVGARLPLSCHRCVDGYTTRTFTKAAQEWEYYCMSHKGDKDILLAAWVDNRYGMQILAKPRWYEKL